MMHEERLDIWITVGVERETGKSRLQTSHESKWKERDRLDTEGLKDVQVTGGTHQGLDSPSACTGSSGMSWNRVALRSLAENYNLVSELAHKM